MITFFHTNLAQHLKGKLERKCISFTLNGLIKGTGPPGEQGMIDILEEEG